MTSPVTTDLSGTAVLTWDGLGAGEEGVAASQVRLGERVVQVFGTFNGASVVLEGSADGQNWFRLSDQFGLSLYFTITSGKTVLESTHYIRPVVIGGDASTSLTVLFSVRKA